MRIPGSSVWSDDRSFLLDAHHSVTHSDQSRTTKPRRQAKRGAAPVKTAGDSARANGLATDDLARRRALGQFFTPPEIAEFMLELVEVFRGRKLPAQARIIDPACGEGVFLRAQDK